MNSMQRLSPRQEALNAILATRGMSTSVLIDEAAWAKLVTLAWDNRSHIGDRREIRRAMRAILMDSARAGGDA